MQSKEFFVGGTGKENTENQEKRSGRALSALAGATGNAKEYEPYLKAIGAA